MHWSCNMSNAHKKGASVTSINDQKKWKTFVKIWLVADTRDLQSVKTFLVLKIR